MAAFHRSAVFLGIVPPGYLLRLKNSPYRCYHWSSCLGGPILIQTGRLVLVLGGARSGKSVFAEAYAKRAGKPVVYLATAEAGDAEMADRIAHHRSRRPDGWRTVEEPRRVDQALAGLPARSVALIDCLTLMVTNVLLEALGPIGETIPPEAALRAERAVEERVAALIGAAEAARAAGSDIIVVANEVGLGLVPAYPLGRLYRDMAGRANQAVARVADEVYFLAAGLPLCLRGPGAGS